MKPGNKPTVTLETKNHIAAMVKRGLGQREVARAAGISQSTVSRIVCELKNDPIPGLPDNPAARAEEFIDSFSDDQSLDCLRGIDHREPSVFTDQAWTEFLHWRKTALTRFAERWPH